MKTLAEKLFEFSELEMELFETVNSILDCNTVSCSKEGFVWGAIDIGFDEYDNSVEVIRPNYAEYMTREQANKILELGFSRIYESCGAKCRVWDKTSHFEASSRESGQILQLKARIKNLFKQLENSTL
jgi:hypothetical protein